MLKEQLLKVLVDYLAKRPFIEVNELIYHLQRLPQVELPAKNKKTMEENNNPVEATEGTPVETAE